MVIVVVVVVVVIVVVVFIFVHGIYRVLHLTGAPLKVLSVSVVSKMF